MPLSLFAAETLVQDYLNGRVLPELLHCAVVMTVKGRLVNGQVPVMDEALCAQVEEHATALPPWSAESVLKAARDFQSA
ncbi:hypothetical protein [Variovorax sp. GT1P44]|uniref:hypothetical protein n=1 Tax=Variovorax sp. GT1P44 TaxID=3443742 RepID=UPI003F472AB1